MTKQLSQEEATELVENALENSTLDEPEALAKLILRLREPMDKSDRDCAFFCVITALFRRSKFVDPATDQFVESISEGHINRYFEEAN